MSGGAVEIDESALNNIRNDYKQHFSQRQQKGFQQPRTQQRHAQSKNNGGGNRHPQRNFAKNNPMRYNPSK